VLLVAVEALELDDVAEVHLVQLNYFNPLPPNDPLLMEQRTLKNVNKCLNTKTYSYLETSGGKSYNLKLNVVHFSNSNVN
jgi:hypothetical protein